MKKRILFLSFLCLTLLIGNKGWGQTPNGSLNFGTTADGTTATTANTGFGGVRNRNPGGGSFVLKNPGESIGTDAELRGIAPTGGSINSVGLTSAEYGTAATTFTVSFEVYFSGGSLSTWYFFAGNGASFGSAQTTGFTSAQVFTGIRWVYGASNTITTNNRAGNVWNATGITGTPFAQVTAYFVTIVGNNSASTVNYGASQSVAANKYDLWINGTLVGDDLAKGELGATTAINAFRFYGENSTGNVATIALDNIRWFNTCVLPPTHLAFVGVPATGTVGINLTSFTVEARSRSASGPVASAFTGNVTLSKATGSGNISGTLSPAAAAGIATYSNIQFDAADTYTMSSSATSPIYSSTSGNVVVSSALTPTIADPNPASLSGFSTTAGTSSAAQTFTVSGTNLTADLVVTAPTDYQVRENEVGSYGSSVSFTPSSGTVSEKTIQVRISASAGIGSPSGNVVCSSTNATSKNVAVSGTVYGQIDWCNLQYPASGTISLGGNFTVYAQVYEPGITNSGGQGAGITAWIGYGTSSSNLSGYTWVSASYNTDAGNNDEYMANIGTAISPAGTYYYASRFQLGSSPFYVYGGYNSGFWDGSTNVSGTLTVNPPPQIDWANLQSPASGSITIGGSFDVYAQVYEPGLTPGAGQGADISAWIGYSATNDNPGTGSGWTWVAANYNSSVTGNNDEYMATIGTSLAAGTYYYASRFKYGLADYVYGGYSSGGGGFWDGSSYISGVLTVNLPPIIINEVDADTPGTDAAEFIELYDGGIGNTSLNGLVIVLFNGNDDKSYLTQDLDGYSTNANGYFVIGSTGMGTPIEIAPGGSGWIQNGADAVALYFANASDFPTGTSVTNVNLIDALVYDTDDADDAGLLVLLNTSQPQVNEGGKGSSANHSNQRLPNGTGGSRNTSTYDQTYPTLNIINAIYTATWTGNTSTSWSIITNWNNSITPDAGTNTNIPDVTNDPILSTTAYCKDLSIAASAKLEIASSGRLTVSGTLTNSAGNTGLVIKSDATGTGSLIEYSGVSATCERYLTDDRWHYISAPVDNPTAGVFMGMYLKYWDEPDSIWVYITNPNQVLATDMIGYALWTYNIGTAVFTGSLNTGAKSINVTAQGINATYEGYNLVGNPYPSAIDWNVDDGSGWTRTSGNVINTLWIWNQSSGNYGVYVKDALDGINGVNNIIPPHQGFFIHCTASTGYIAVDNGARIHNTKEILKSSPEWANPVIKLKIEGNSFSDEIILNVLQEAGVNYEEQTDALKLKGYNVAPQLFSLSKDGKELSYNSFPESEDYNVIPLGLEVGASASYTISASQFSGFGSSNNIILEDKKEGVFLKLNGEDFTYTFNASPLDDPMRFLLHLNGELGISQNIADESGFRIYSYENYVYVTSKESVHGTITVHDLLGKVLFEDEMNGELVRKIDIGNNKGFNIVTLVSDKGKVAQKVFIQ